ncbi:MAG: hemerythrin domain-containing protein [Zoogloeaceae bacterium]|nr:hemerythrin domain-containing protein [Zoogloeaceae bacterium]
MSGITQALNNHHKLCDDNFADAEEAAHKGDWTACAATYGKFRDAMLTHFGVEEDILFPAFESNTGMTGGPTQVMRGEHVQMRDLLQQMDAALGRKDADGFGGAAETLLVMMQQHNMKEENILYPMCDQALGEDGELASRIAAGLNA